MDLKEYANKKITESNSLINLTWKDDLIKKYIKNNSVILDIGCGPASLANKFTIDKNNYFGIDYNESFVNNGLKKGLNLSQIDLSIQDIPFEENKFDFIYCSHVIEHLETDRQINLFFEISRVLKKDGVLLMLAPTPYHWFFWDDPTHKRPVTHGSLTHLSNNVGLKVIYSKYSLLRFLSNNIQRWLRITPLRWFLWEVFIVSKK